MCKDHLVSQSTETGHLDALGWDQVDRLNKAVRVSGLTVSRLADALGVHRNTIGNYLSGRTQADKRTLMAWALATGVPYGWLTDGKTPADGPGGPDDGGGVVRREGIEPPTR